MPQVSTSWKAWAGGVLGAAITGLADAIVLHVVAPDTFAFTAAGLSALGKVLLLSTVVKVAFWVKRHPVPGSED